MYLNWYKLSHQTRWPSFSCGYCFEYALALHEKTGYPLAAVNGYYWDSDYDEWEIVTAHIFVLKDKTTGIDSVGERSVNEIINDSIFDRKPDKVQIDPVSVEEAEFLTSSEGKNEEAYLKATQAVDSIY